MAFLGSLCIRESLKCLVWSDKLKIQVYSLNNLAKQSFCQIFMLNVTLLKQKLKKQHEETEEKGKIRKHEQEISV